MKGQTSRSRSSSSALLPFVFCFFFLGGLPYQVRLQKKGTLILPSLLEDLEVVCSRSAWQERRDGGKMWVNVMPARAREPSKRSAQARRRGRNTRGLG